MLTPPSRSVCVCVCDGGEASLFLGKVEGGGDPTGRSGAGLFMTKQGLYYPNKKTYPISVHVHLNHILLSFLAGAEHEIQLKEHCVVFARKF